MDDMLLCPLQLLTRVIYHDASLYGKTKLYISEDNIFCIVCETEKREQKGKVESAVIHAVHAQPLQI